MQFRVSPEIFFNLGGDGLVDQGGGATLTAPPFTYTGSIDIKVERDIIIVTNPS